MKFKLLIEQDSVHILLPHCNSSLEAFIDIYVDDGTNDSIFENVEDAKLFAEIVIKLLEHIG